MTDESPRPMEQTELREIVIATDGKSIKIVKLEINELEAWAIFHKLLKQLGG